MGPNSKPINRLISIQKFIYNRANRWRLVGKEGNHSINGARAINYPCGKNGNGYPPHIIPRSQL